MSSKNGEKFNSITDQKKYQLNADNHLLAVRVHLESLGEILRKNPVEGPLSHWTLLAVRQAQLNVRFTIEELMVLSVSAHYQAGNEISKRLRKTYRAGTIAESLKGINPAYFPRAIAIVPTDEPGIAGRFVAREGNHLTEEEAIDYWNSAGNFLHARSKFLSENEAKEGLASAKQFLKLTCSLLETFEVDLSGNGMWTGGHLNYGKDGPPQLFRSPQK